MTIPLAQAQSGHAFPIFLVFALFVVCTLFLSVGSTSDRDSLSEFYVGRRQLSPVRNGLAIFGCYMSAAGLLGNPGLIALNGYDGFAYLLAPAVAWSVLLLLVAEPYHGMTRFTVGDSLARRLRPRPAHLASGIATLVISLLYLTAQLVGAGTLAAPVLGMHGPGAQRTIVAFLGLLMILYVVVGGMRAATLLQQVKAALLLAGGLFLTFMVLSRFGWSPDALLEAAARRSGYGDDFLRPGITFGDSASKLDSLSLQLAFLLGAAGLPHVLMRVGTVSTGPNARRSVQWATLLITSFSVAAALLGLGAAALLGSRAVWADSPSGNTAVIQLSDYLGGPLLLTIVSCLLFATIVAVVAGLTLTAAASVARDIYGGWFKQGAALERNELRMARTGAVLVGATAIVLSMCAQHLNVSFLVGLAFAIAASAVLPSVLFNLWWKGFTTRGALWSVYGGLLSLLLLVSLSPAVSGNPTALLPHADFAVFPLRNPGIVSIPLGFLLGWCGSVLDRREPGARTARRRRSASRPAPTSGRAGPVRDRSPG